MIVREFYRRRSDRKDLYRTYSDQNLKIKQVETGNIYNEAIDVRKSKFTYEETDIPVEKIEDKEEKDGE